MPAAVPPGSHSEALLRELVQHLPTPAALEHGDQVILNAASQRLLGRMPASPCPLDEWRELLNGNGSDTSEQRRGRPLNTATETRRVELTLPGGERRSVDFTPTASGGGVFWTLQEVHAVPLAERGEFERLAVLFERVPAIMCTLMGPEYVFDVVNPRCREFFDRELRGRGVREALPELVSQGFLAMLDRVHATGEPVIGIATPITLDLPSGAPGQQRFLDFVYQPMTGVDGAISGVFAHGTDVTERVTAARERERLLAQLEQEHAFLEAVLEQIPLGIVLTEAMGRPHRINSLAEKYLGGAAEALRRCGATEEMEGYHVDGRRLALDEWPIPRALTGQVTVGQIVRYPQGDEPNTWLRIAAGPIRDRVGAVIGVIAAVEDITAQRATEAALLASEERFRAVLEASPDGFMLYQAVRDATRAVVDFDVSYVNTAGARIRGRSAAGLTGRRVLDELPGVRRVGLFDAYVRVVETGTPFQQELEYRADGIDGYFRVTAVRVGDAVGVSLNDLTAHHHAEQTVRHSEARLSALLEHAIDIVLVCDADGTTRYASPSIERAIGLPAADAVGMNVLERVHPEDQPRALATMQTLPPHGVPSEPDDFRIQHVDGRWRIMRNIVRNLLDDPAVRGLVITGRDVTESRQVEEQLRQAQKMEAIGRLAGGIAHDFNNLLTVINGYAAFLHEDLVEGDPRRDDAIAIERAGHRAAALTGQLLAFSRQQVLEPRIVDPNDVIRGVEQMLGRLIGEHIELTLTLDPAVGSIVIDPGQLEQALTNLVVNARDAMPRGGALSISTTLRDDAAAESMCRPDVVTGACVAIAVRDQGEGITPEVLAHVFEPFFTTKGQGKGTGLGLATVYGIVEQSGGRVEVTSAVGEGTTFTLYFPVSTREATSRAVDSVPALAPLHSEHVLLVEDEDAVRAIVRRMLAGSGFTVMEARNGLEALHLASDTAVRIDILLTDAVMPMMGGVDLLREVRRVRPGLPGVLMTGYTDEQMIRSGELDPATRLLQKPFTTDGLLRAMQESLAAHGAPDARTP
jgi:two-component system cell cycle sensor histidine kinase/response regulator CckA